MIPILYTAAINAALEETMEMKSKEKKKKEMEKMNRRTFEI